MILLLFACTAAAQHSEPASTAESSSASLDPQPEQVQNMKFDEIYSKPLFLATFLLFIHLFSILAIFWLFLLFFATFPIFLSYFFAIFLSYFFAIFGYFSAIYSLISILAIFFC